MDTDRKEEITGQEMAAHEHGETTEADARGYRPKNR
jgi:hypothetical protein